MLKIGSFLMTGILTLFAGFSTVDSATAQETHSRRGGWPLRGNIVAIEEDTLTIEGAQGAIRVMTGDETRVHIIGEDDADLSDLDEGDSVLVRGVRQEEGRPLARLIVRLPEGDLVHGRITSVGEDSLELDAQGRQVTVSVNSEAVVALGRYEMLWSGEPAGRDALRAGMRLAAFGTFDEESLEMTAHTLVSHLPRPRYSIGVITAIEGDEITLQRINGRSVTLFVDEYTQFRVGNDADASLAAFEAGDRVAVFGRRIPGSEVIVALRLAKRG